MLTPAQIDLCVFMKLDLERRRGMFAVLYMYTEVSFSAHTNKHTHTHTHTRTHTHDLIVGCCLITPLILYIIMYAASSTSTSRLCLLLAGMCVVCVCAHTPCYLCTVYAHMLVVGPADSHYEIMDENHPRKISPFMDGSWLCLLCGS